MAEKYDVRPDQSVALLKALHILTRDGKLNQDSRRKLKQVYHLVQFIEPLVLEELSRGPLTLVDHGAGKSYLGFLLNDLVCKNQEQQTTIIGIESRPELVTKSQALAQASGFSNMRFLQIKAEESAQHPEIPENVGIVTALHACDTATDDAIRFAIDKSANHVVVVPCCQAEVAAQLRKVRSSTRLNPLSAMWWRPLHAREFGSHLTNVLRCLQLEAHGYEVTVTELVGWEHSMKNELIIATQKGKDGEAAAERKAKILDEVGLASLAPRFA